jgi:hypothetical protein
MFYADEMIYIFEGEQAEMIVIPRLPVQVNIAEIEPYQVPLSMMDAGEIPVGLDILKSVPETWLFSDGEEVTLSTWGQLLWNQCKGEILGGDLLEFPGICYQQSFKEDYQDIVSQQERVKLQETLAKVAQLLAKSQGNIAVLKEDGGLQYSRYRNTDIDHFRVDLSLRVSCQLVGRNLMLRYYGSHAHVEGKELNN